MTARHSPLFTLESGQSGLGIYTSGRDAARAVLVAIGINALGYREVLGIAVATAKPRASGDSSWARSRKEAWRHLSCDLGRLSGAEGGDQANVPGLLLAALPGALPAQPAVPRAQGWPGHGGGRCHESGVLTRLGEIGKMIGLPYCSRWDRRCNKASMLSIKPRRRVGGKPQLAPIGTLKRRDTAF